jgi:hypothetical protein
MAGVVRNRWYEVSNRRLNAVMEDICQRGCRYVNGILADAEKRRACEHLRQLNSSERASVLSELRAVMSVYDKTGSCDI